MSSPSVRIGLPSMTGFTRTHALTSVSTITTNARNLRFWPMSGSGGGRRKRGGGSATCRGGARGGGRRGPGLSARRGRGRRRRRRGDLARDDLGGLALRVDALAHARRLAGAVAQVVELAAVHDRTLAHLHVGDER